MKKLSLGVRVVSVLIMTGCGTQNQAVQPSAVVSNQAQQETQTIKEDTNALGMNIHMCLMGGGENCDEYLDPGNKEEYAALVQEQCDMMPGMEACDVYFADDADHGHDGTEGEDHHDESDDHGHDGSEGAGHDDDAHGNLDSAFEGVVFTSDTVLAVNGYDITIKHKDDIHAGEKITRTVSVMQGGSKLDGFQKIDGDDGVGIVKHPGGTIDHLHPLAYTDSSLTFSVATEELGTYQILTQFKHNDTVVNVPYAIELTALADDDHAH